MFHALTNVSQGHYPIIGGGVIIRMKSLDARRPAHAAGGANSMEALLAEALDFRPLRAGDIVDGTILRISPSEIIVDIG